MIMNKIMGGPSAIKTSVLQTNPFPGIRPFTSMEDKYFFGRDHAISEVLDELRSKVGELPLDRRIIIVCQRGTRSYEASLILSENGFKDVLFIGGGMLFAKVFDSL